MSFVHQDSEFADLLQIVANERRLSRGLVEKDYWVTHTLWSLHAAGLDVWFKGGTSLSKGFLLIERFSEDLDLKMEPGRVETLPKVSNWKSEGARATSERKAFFEALATFLVVPGARAQLDHTSVDAAWRAADIQVHYPGHFLRDLNDTISPFVRLEIGSARVTPFVECDLTSFVHEKLSVQKQLGDFQDNRPKAVRCVHPLVTLLEKLDALHRRFPKDSVDPAAFVRHYEDAARVIAAAACLPPLPDRQAVQELALEMAAQRQLTILPTPTDPCFNPVTEPRWQSIRSAHAAIGPMFWGPRISMEDACAAIRTWCAANLT